MTIHCNFSISTRTFLLFIYSFFISIFHRSFWTRGSTEFVPLSVWLLFIQLFMLDCSNCYVAFTMSLSLFYSLVLSLSNTQHRDIYVVYIYCVYVLNPRPLGLFFHCWHSTLHQIQSAIVSSLIIIFHFLTWATQQKRQHRNKFNRI